MDFLQTKQILISTVELKQGESLSIMELEASTRIISASDAFAGYFTPYQSR